MPPLTSRNAAIVALLVACAYAGLLAVGKVVPRYDCITLAVALLAIFRVLDRASPQARAVALHGVTQVLVFAFLVHLWTLGYEGRNAVFGGILPWSDSFDYYDDALRLVHGERFTEFSSKRPIFGVVLAGLLRLSGGDLRLALFVCAVVGAWATALAALEVWRTHGGRAALVVYVILLCFERRWTGFIQTEHVGLPLGAIGFALFWRANARRDADPTDARRLALVGLFAIATGLMARAGAFFVLPLLGLWGARRLVPDADGRGARVGFLALAALASLAGFALHKTVLFATGSGVTFSDYPGIAYGLLHGEDYTYLVQTHPQLGALGVAERVPEAWRIVAADARAQPMLVVTGFARSFAGLFVSPFGMFSYVWTNPDDHVLEDGALVRASMAEHGVLGPLFLWVRSLGVYSLLNAAAMGVLAGAFVVAVIVALVKMVRSRRDADLSLLRYAMGGVLLSAPFTPPWITSGMQVQTVTLAFVAAAPAVLLFGHPQRGGSEPAPRRGRLVYAPLGFAAALFALVALVRLAPETAPTCAFGRPANEQTLRLYPGTAVEVRGGRSLVLRDKAIADLRASVAFLAKHNPELTDSIVPYLTEGTVYVAAFDACDRRAKLLVDDRRALDLAPAWRTVSASRLASPNVLRVQTPVEP